MKLLSWILFIAFGLTIVAALDEWIPDKRATQLVIVMIYGAVGGIVRAKACD